MSGTISTGIPSNVLVPGFYGRLDPSQAGVLGTVRRALIVGQSTSAAALGLNPVQSVAQAASTYGAGSPLAHQIAAFRANETLNELWAINLPPAGTGTAATGALVFSGTATGAGSHPLYIAGWLVSVPVASGDTASTQATNVAAAINAFLDQSSGTPLQLPVTASPTGSTVNLSARSVGTYGNAVPLLYAYRGLVGGEAAPAGTTVAVTPMASGAGDPDLSVLANLMGSVQFEWVNNPWSTAAGLGFTTAIHNDTTGRWSYASQLYGHVFSAAANTYANLLSLGPTLANDPHLAVWGINPASPTPIYVWGAAFMGALLARLRDEPGRPATNLPVRGVLPEPLAAQFNFSNENSLLGNGIAEYRVGPGGNVYNHRAVTTYLTNPSGQTDRSQLDTETMYQNAGILARLRFFVTSTWPDYRLGDDTAVVSPGVPIVTPLIIRGGLIAQYTLMAADGWVQNVDAFATGLIVQRDPTDPSRVNVIYPAINTAGLRVFALTDTFRFR